MEEAVYHFNRHTRKSLNRIEVQDFAESTKALH